jgi:hypothetical protein
MDYTQRVKQSSPEFTIDVGMPYGDMPSAMLMKKFEETDAGPDDELYDDYARNTLTNWGPDQNLMEHERPRGAANRSYGVLELRANGHRGKADYERPESFHGFGGPEDRDPRGTNVGPDMKELTKQQQARMRFKRFTSDSAEHITGGGRSEAKVIADNQKVFKIRRERLKVFSRQIDGRREGMRRSYNNKSDVTKQVLVQSYGDYLRDYSLNPQRRANIIAKQIIRDSREWRDETADQDYQVALYSQHRKRKTSTTANATAQSHTDGKFEDNDDNITYRSQSYKAAGLLMSHLCRGTTDADMDASSGTQTRKTGPYRDLMVLMESQSQDTKFKEGDMTQSRKQAAQKRRAHQGTVFTTDHSTPSHHLHNTELIYKAVSGDKDFSKIKKHVATDAKAPHISDTATVAVKRSVSVVNVHGSKLDTTDDGDYGEQQKTVNYKRALKSRVHRKTATGGHDFKKESDNSQVRKTQNKSAVAAEKDVEGTTKLGKNHTKERHIAPMGSKYMHRSIARDNDIDDING